LKEVDKIIVIEKCNQENSEINLDKSNLGFLNLSIIFHNSFNFFIIFEELEKINKIRLKTKFMVKKNAFS
jgi:hypothetical protein